MDSLGDRLGAYNAALRESGSVRPRIHGVAIDCALAANAASCWHFATAGLPRYIVFVKGSASMWLYQGPRIPQAITHFVTENEFLSTVPTAIAAPPGFFRGPPLWHIATKPLILILSIQKKSAGIHSSFTLWCTCLHKHLHPMVPL